MKVSIPIKRGKTGIYTLIIELRQERETTVGRLGVYNFPKGVYTYIGSALGRGSTDLRGRLLRHVSDKKRHHWHIDYLLSAKDSQIKHVVFFETYKQEECTIVKKLLSLRGKIIIRGFGSSDCKSGCGSHLLFFENNNIQNVLKIVKNAYKTITAKGTVQEISLHG